jgi:hypothetical protein
MSYMIVILNKDGSFFSSYRETNLIRGRVMGLLFDNYNFVTAALDVSLDGTALKRNSVIVKFSVGVPSASGVTPSFLISAGNTLRVS